MLADACQAVPPKAQEMLGLKVHAESPRSETSWLRPKIPERFDDDQSAERLKVLTVNLNQQFRKLLTEIHGRRLQTGDETLVRAVQEIIRLGESGGGGGGVREKAAT